MISQLLTTRTSVEKQILKNMNEKIKLLIIQNGQ